MPQKKNKKVTDITVRMNHVGFGDSFLVTFHSGDGDKKVLIDCGVHSAGTNPKLSMEKAITNILDDIPGSDEEKYIDIVVCTHRHQDHISGFADKRWSNVSVGEVWMPWTEDPQDKDAKKIKAGQLKVAAALSSAIEGRKKIGLASADVLQRLDNFAVNASGNAAAMNTLHKGFANEALRRFFPSKKNEENSFKLGILPDVTVHVLGPSRIPSVIRKMDPPKGQSYFAMMELDRAESPISAFKPAWRVDKAGYQRSFPHLAIGPDWEKKLTTQSLELEQSVASWLDSAINGTSLVIVFEVNEEFLLFSGDAQWGTWSAMMSDPDVRELLGRTTFYKVGHHCSHNATPIEFCEKIATKNLKHAMASVYPVKQWKNIPRPPLLEKLESITGKRTKVSYVPDSGGDDFKVGPSKASPEWTELKIKV